MLFGYFRLFVYLTGLAIVGAFSIFSSSEECVNTQCPLLLAPFQTIPRAFKSRLMVITVTFKWLANSSFEIELF